jgi:basic membrane protein A
MLSKKRILSALVSAVMIFSVALTGCSGGDASSTAAPSDKPANSKEETTSTALNKGKKMNVAVLLNGTLGDKAFFDSAASGAKMMVDQLGCTTKVIEMGYDETKWLPTLIDASEDPSYDVIIVGTWQMSEKLQQIAPQYPDKKYIIFDSSVDYKKAKFENVYSIEYKQNECAYLAGAVGALTTKTGKIGFVGGMENTVINDFLMGYIQGAKEANPKIKVSVAYVGNFSDSARAKELTLAQINQGSDIVFQVASTAGLGVIDGCTEKGKYAIGVDSDQAEALKASDPKKAAAILTSALKRVDVSIFNAIKEAQQGTLIYGQAVSLGIAENCVGLAKNDTYNAAVSKDVQKKIEEFSGKIANGSAKVDSAFGKTADQVEAVRASVRP